MDTARANSIPVTVRGSQTTNGGHSSSNPPSPFSDYSSSPVAISPSASTATTDLTSLPSEASKLSLDTVKRSSLGVPPAVTCPYSPSSALDDIPGIAYALDLFLKSRMVESEEYCNTSDPKKCAIHFFQMSLLIAENWRAVVGNACISPQASA